MAELKTSNNPTLAELAERVAKAEAELKSSSAEYASAIARTSGIPAQFADLLPKVSGEAVPEPQRPTVKMAPVNIDISKAVEKAVASAMARFDVVLSKRIRASYDTPAEGAVASGAAVADSAIGALGQKVADDGEFLAGKLAALIENMKTMNDEMVALSAAYMDIAEKQKELVEEQKKTNDVQRYTMREQQGVQVSQRVIGKDQIAVTEQQNLIQEQQHTVAQRQQFITESQQGVMEDQEALIASQAALEDAVKSVMTEQAGIIETQREIMKGNCDNIDVQEAMLTAQAEVTAYQKEVLASQRQVSREQKLLVEKQKANAELSRAISESVKGVIKENKALADAIEREKTKTPRRAPAKKAEPVAEPEVKQEPAMAGEQA